MQDTGRFIRTVVQLKPSQIAHRVRLRAQKVAFARGGEWLGRYIARPVPGSWGWPQGFVPLDAAGTQDSPSAVANTDGVFRFLAETRTLGSPADWQQLGAAQLWRYHLHYFEWAWALARHDDRPWARHQFERLFRSWKLRTRFGQWDAWSPYVVAVRTWALCGLHGSLVGNAEWEPDFAEDLALHAGFVAANLELDVGGNHLMKDIKAMIGVGVWLRDEALVTRGMELLRKQIGIQVLGDGGHFERSPSYHAQVLGDLIDIAGLLDAANRPPVPGLEDVIAAMRTWLGTMLGPDGAVPLLNDCTAIPPERLAALGVTQPPAQTLTVLEASGYVVARVGRWHIVADVGLPCPRELPAHAHADTLSFVAWLDDEAVVLDTGTSEYGAGPRREYERSTAAHNTIELDGMDSTEVWGGFRAGRRARPALASTSVSAGGETMITASHDGYRHLRGRPIHRRTWRIAADGIDVIDEVTGSGRHFAVARLHSRLDRVTARAKGAVATTVKPGETPTGVVARDFGVLEPVACVEMATDGELPLRLHTMIRAACGESHDPAYDRPS